MIITIGVIILAYLGIGAMAEALLGTDTFDEGVICFMWPLMLALIVAVGPFYLVYQVSKKIPSFIYRCKHSNDPPSPTAISDDSRSQAALERATGDTPITTPDNPPAVSEAAAIAAVASKLSAPAKDALALFDSSQLHGLLIPEPGDEATVRELFDAGCIARILAAGHEFIDRTDLGLRVRAHLLGESA